MLLRPAKKSDVAFILDSWMKSWRRNKMAGCIPNNMYYDVTRSNIENLVARGAKFTVLCLENDEDAILGWICREKLKDGTECVHYSYTKDPYLKMGAPQKLVEGLPNFGFYTYKFNQVVEMLPGWRWCPEIARRKE